MVCDAKIMGQIISLCGLNLKVNAVLDPAEGVYQYGTIDVLDMKNVDESFQFNTVSAMTGKASFEYVAKVIELARARLIDATITGPIHKEAIQKAGFNYAGHTEIYAALTNTKDYTMSWRMDISELFTCQRTYIVQMQLSALKKTGSESDSARRRGFKENRHRQSKNSCCRLEPTCGGEWIVWNRRDRRDYSSD